jgi:uncharacterized membrane protein
MHSIRLIIHTDAMSQPLQCRPVITRFQSKIEPSNRDKLSTQQTVPVVLPMVTLFAIQTVQFTKDHAARHTAGVEMMMLTVELVVYLDAPAELQLQVVPLLDLMVDAALLSVVLLVMQKEHLVAVVLHTAIVVLPLIIVWPRVAARMDAQTRSLQPLHSLQPLQLAVAQHPRLLPKNQ